MISETRGAGGVPGKEGMLAEERKLRAAGIELIAGIDEAGRGPLAGPVVAAAVIFPAGAYIPEVDDSKRLTPGLREELCGEILQMAAAVGTGIVGNDLIDEMNILNATFLAMDQAVASLGTRPTHLLIDGHMFRPGQVTAGIPFTTIIGGDHASFCIAAASIVAKVTRDRLMVAYDREFPEFGFARHKGYGTAEHRAAIARHGYSPIHRRSFTLHAQVPAGL
jgi:ribonuclease HII